MNFLNYLKEPKIYETILDIDNIKFKKFLDKEYLRLKKYHIENNKYTQEDIDLNVTYDPGSYSEDFNIFNTLSPELYIILFNIKKLLIKACSEYGIDFNLQKYAIHGWLNYFPDPMNLDRSYDNLFWHDHGNHMHHFHGYYAVNAEPSITHYKLNNKKVDRKNKNGSLILAKTGIPHAIGKWNEAEPRITIAYDLVPLEDAINSKHGTSLVPFSYLV